MRVTLLVCALLGGALGLLAIPGEAADASRYPARAIDLIVPQAAGGAGGYVGPDHHALYE